MDQLYSASLKSNDPKEFMKSNFKNEMKQAGLDKELKNLKSFKFCLASRSQETLDVNKQTKTLE